MRLRHYILSSALLLMGGLLALMIPTGCGSDGNLTETVDIEKMRDLSGIAGPATGTPTPVARVPRGPFGEANTVAALAYPDVANNAEERAVFERALAFFITDRTPENGLGPVFNQRICLGCHRSSAEAEPGFGLTSTSTPVSRGSRFGPTDHAAINTAIINGINTNQPLDETTGKPPTAAFTLFGVFFPATGIFNAEPEFGGPIQHVRATDGCFPDFIPPESIDPFLRGGVDPITGLSALGARRAVGERAAPPYIGRGLMEAVYAGDIVANEDPIDAQGHTSTLLPTPTTSGCPTGGDCISGRHNENQASNAFIGGDPVVRLSRFGLRAAGPTLMEFDVGGTQGEIGVTSPFSPIEQVNPQNVGRNCDRVADPELRADEVLELRTLIRLIAPPEFDPCLLFGFDGVNCTDAAKAANITAGAALFGVDLTAFRNRMTGTGLPDGLNDNAINVADRQLNCVGCHIPIIRTGQSPAGIGARHLSNKWAPLFSDLLIHNMGQIPQGLSNPVPQPPFSLDGGTTFEIPRNLADFALPNQGLAFGTEFRTPPLMGIGRVGPPHMHDGRVYLATTSVRRARTVRSSSDGGTNAALPVNTPEDAILAAIELHDLPRPGAGCPVFPGGSTSDTCPPLTGGGSENRSEARNVIERFRNLTTTQQNQVVAFLRAL